MNEDYTVKDSGERVDFKSGMRRDVDEGKPRYDLIDRQGLRRHAVLMAKGAEKYGERNWQLATSEEELNRFKASAFRHFMQWLNGDIDEDHAASVKFNIDAAEMVQAKLDHADSGWNGDLGEQSPTSAHGPSRFVMTGYDKDTWEKLTD